MKHVMIAGAAGFIGSHLAERFLREGYQVTGVDNFLTGNRENMAHLIDNNQFTFLEQDVTEAFSTDSKTDIVMHFACPASPVDYLKFPIETMKVDSAGTFNTLDIAKKHGARYIMASTSEIYGDPMVHPQSESYWGNVNPVGPRSVYDEAKRFSEAACMAYHRKHGLDTRIVRIFNTYGPRMRERDGRVIPNFICSALNNTPLTVYGDGSQTRSFCYIDDLVNALFTLATAENLDGEILNLGNPGEISIKTLSGKIIKQCQSSSTTINMPLPEDDPRRRKPDISRARKLLKWEPAIDLQEGLDKTISYFKNAKRKGSS